MQHFYQRQSHKQGKQGRQHCLTQKLHHKLAAAGAKRLAQRDLTRPQHGPRGGQVHEVEAGNQQDQDADDAHAIERGPTARRRHAAPAVRGQVHVAEGREMDPIGLAALGGCRRRRARRRRHDRASALSWRSRPSGRRPAPSRHSHSLLGVIQLCLAAWLMRPRWRCWAGRHRRQAANCAASPASRRSPSARPSGLCRSHRSSIAAASW